MTANVRCPRCEGGHVEVSVDFDAGDPYYPGGWEADVSSGCDECGAGDWTAAEEDRLLDAGIDAGREYDDYARGRV